MGVSVTICSGGKSGANPRGRRRIVDRVTDDPNGSRVLPDHFEEMDRRFGFIWKPGWNGIRRDDMRKISPKLQMLQNPACR